MVHSPAPAEEWGAATYEQRWTWCHETSSGHAGKQQDISATKI